MKRFLVLIGILSALAAAHPAVAGHEDDRRAQRYERQDDGRRGNDREMRDPRQGRDNQVERRGRRESLSPDQRRQLRRDIEDHGRDVYRERRDRR